jgi:hypothetical protein
VSIAVGLEELPGRIAARTGQAYLVSVRERRPHVVAVAPTVEDDGTLRVGAGRRTALNVAEHPEVTVLWPTDGDDPRHTLLVDGTAAPTTDGEALVVTPTTAVLHRVRTADATGPAAR